MSDGCPDWIVPDWPAPPGVRALCTTRSGGVSAGPWGSMNLGWRAGDDPRAVAANRATLERAIGHAPRFLRQVHGCEVVVWDTTGGEADPDQEPAADAATTTQPGAVCAVMVADCLPVLLADRRGGQVAAAHAGWRGLAGGVLEQVVERFRPFAHSLPESLAPDLIAWLGPCIGPSTFDVGEEVREAFVASDPGAGICFRRPDGGGTPGKWLADLPGLARRRLERLGITDVYGNDGGNAWCTVSQTSRFFSHRRDSVAFGGTGRMAACIWIDR